MDTTIRLLVTVTFEGRPDGAIGVRSVFTDKRIITVPSVYSMDEVVSATHLALGEVQHNVGLYNHGFTGVQIHNLDVITLTVPMKQLSEILPQGDSKDDLTRKMLELYMGRFKTHTFAFISELLHAMDEKQLKELYLKLVD